MSLSATYFAVPWLDVRGEAGTLWTDCPHAECTGWTAAASTFDELFALVAEWHADKLHGWMMIEPFRADIEGSER